MLYIFFGQLQPGDLVRHSHRLQIHCIHHHPPIAGLKDSSILSEGGLPGLCGVDGFFDCCIQGFCASQAFACAWVAVAFGLAQRAALVTILSR